MATQSGVSDAAALDQLESAAKDAWLDPAAMDLWISRGRQLAAAADAHTSNLERLQKHASADEKGNLQFRDHEHRFQYETLSLLISRLRRFRTALLAAAEHVRDVVGELDYLHETEYKPAWDEALKEIGTLALYHGLEMKAQRRIGTVRP